jgi:hypothetical protein
MYIKEANLIRTEDLPGWLDSNAIAWQRQKKLGIGFGVGQDQYRLFRYPGPADDETMGLFCEWHTEDYFDADSGPHIAIGLRGPVPDDPHRGRGLAIGILSAEQFEGCPPAPGGPAMFIEDFTINEGTAAVRDWQLSRGKALPSLGGNGVYRIDIHVSRQQVWAGVWQVSMARATSAGKVRDYLFLGQVSCSPDMPACRDNAAAPCPEAALDKGVGNAFIGTGFSNPESRSWIDSIFLAHWKTASTA